MKDEKPKTNLFLRIIGSKILAYLIIVALVIVIVTEKTHPVTVVDTYDPCAAKVDVSRHAVNKYTRPNLLNDEYVECTDLSTLKYELTRYIEQEQSRGGAHDVSVFLRKPNTLSWFEINGHEKYMPSSIMKISIMIPYLLEARLDHELLQRKIYFGKRNQQLNRQNIVASQLKENTYYTVYELLYALMAHSDNDASSLLAKNMDMAVYKQLFSDLNLSEPDIFNSDYTMNVVECSKFFRLLYTSNYLGREMSELALELLTHCDYQDGILSGLDGAVPVAHKFGERTGNGFKELHEGGIVYVENRPYVLCVMTRGTDYEKLSDIIGNISRTVFSHLK